MLGQKSHSCWAKKAPQHGALSVLLLNSCWDLQDYCFIKSLHVTLSITRIKQSSHKQINVGGLRYFFCTFLFGNKKSLGSFPCIKPFRTPRTISNLKFMKNEQKHRKVSKKGFYKVAFQISASQNFKKKKGQIFTAVHHFLTSVFS